MSVQKQAPGISPDELELLRQIAEGDSAAAAEVNQCTIARAILDLQDSLALLHETRRAAMPIKRQPL